jgi:hypothetical protein
MNFHDLISFKGRMQRKKGVQIPVPGGTKIGSSVTWRWLIVTGLIWLGISILFFFHSKAHGGAAIHGNETAGHYYLGSHGNHPEVTRGVFMVSALLSAAFGLSLSLFAGVLIWRQARKATFSSLPLIGPVLALGVGLVTSYLSIRCIVSAL